MFDWKRLTAREAGVPLWRTLRIWRETLAANTTLMMIALVASLAGYYVVAPPVLSLPLLAAYALLAWLRLDLAVCVLPLAFPFWYVPKRVTSHAVFPLSEIALALCTGVALARTGWSVARSRQFDSTIRRLHQAFTRVGRPLALAIAGFVVAGTFGVLIARQPRAAYRDYRWEIVEPLLYLALVLVYARGDAAQRRMIWAFLGSAGVLAALAAIQMTFARVTFSALASGNHLIPLARDSDGVVRATAFVYGSGNSLAAYVERALPLAVALLLPRGLRAMQRRERVLAAALCVAYVAALYWSASRGAWLASVIALLVVVGVVLERVWLALTLGVLAVAAVFWQRNGLVAAALAGHNGSGQMRALLWLAAWHMIRDHPILGIGLDQFLYYYSSLYTNHPYWITVLNGHPTQAWREPTLAHPHNLVLDIWLSIGLLGLVAFAVVLAIFWARCVQAWRARPRTPSQISRSAPETPDAPSREGRGMRWSRVVGAGLGASMLAAVLHGMVDSAYFVPDLALIFWWSVGVLLVTERSSQT
jgi:O-antigen ligase/polysaccharide polymerase Wzy-like membrane protein